MKDNEMRHVIHDTSISSGQCPRRDVTVGYGLQGYTKKTSGKTYTCQKEKKREDKEKKKKEEEEKKKKSPEN
jgi:hypothetical protein